MRYTHPLLLATATLALAACGSSPDPENPTDGPTETVEGNPCAGLVSWYLDSDNDGYGDPNTLNEECDPPPGYISEAGDCNDANRKINPDAVEICDPDDADEDCNGLADDEDEAAEGKVEAWPDADMDGYGDATAAALTVCNVGYDRSLDNDDCDDSEPGAYPGAAYEESLLDCMKDADGDGYGDSSAGPWIQGTDCDDTSGQAYPYASEIWVDGLDQDCDGADDFSLLDGFEGGVFDPANWQFTAGSILTEDYASDGDASLMVPAGITTRSLEFDSSLCTSMTYSYRVKRGPLTPSVTDTITLQYADVNNQFQTADQVFGTGMQDAVFGLRTGSVDDVNAYHANFQVRLKNNGGGDFYIDELMIGCPGDDLDGDGVPGLLDCDDTDDRHWEDCGVCVDLDNDGYGDGCDLGGDCDDNDAAASPAGPDAPGDGLDANCDGYDGVVLLDTFELGTMDSRVWSTLVGDAAVTSGAPVASAFSLEFGTAGEANLRVFDTTLCPSVTWYYLARRGPAAPLITDSLSFQYDDGSGNWITVDTLVGNNASDGNTLEQWGEIVDAAVFQTALKMRLVSDSLSGGSFFVDDLVVGCPVDQDVDGRGEVVDCDDIDPAHWGDCGFCVDADGDDYGHSCDLGLDCDDTDPSVNPLGSEIPSDGIDQDCDTIDASGLIDNFDAGFEDPLVWQALSGDTAVTNTYSHSGYHALRMAGAGALATTATLDATLCPAIAWKLATKRGPETPDAGVSLALELFDGATWSVVDEVLGDGTDDATFSFQVGATTDGAYRRSDFQARLSVTGGIAGEDIFYVDDFAVVCGDLDMDRDGWSPPLDCDDNDPNHWDDCWTCIDEDGDGWGTVCNDQLDDCYPADPFAYPGAIDPSGDGIDQDCNGSDGSGIRDDFELGVPDPEVWDFVTGDTFMETLYSVSGTYSMNMGGGIAEAQTLPIDTVGCGSVSWYYNGKRGPESPDSSDFLRVEYWNGSTWIIHDEWFGAGGTDANFTFRSGEITDANALREDFMLRLYSDGTGATFDDYFVDDFALGCTGADSDGDGIPVPADCDDADPGLTFEC